MLFNCLQTTVCVKFTPDADVMPVFECTDASQPTTAEHCRDTVFFRMNT